jgi:hypothetical protein
MVPSTVRVPLMLWSRWADQANPANVPADRLAGDLKRPSVPRPDDPVDAVPRPEVAAAGKKSMDRKGNRPDT